METAMAVTTLLSVILSGAVVLRLLDGPVAALTAASSSHGRPQPRSRETCPMPPRHGGGVVGLPTTTPRRDHRDAARAAEATRRKASFQHIPAPQPLFRPPPGSTMPSDRSLPAPGRVEVRIIAASPDAARKVAETLRSRFAATEQRSYPAGHRGGGTRLHLTVDIAQSPEGSEPFRPWLVTSHPHADEIQDATRVHGTGQNSVTFALGGVRVSRKRG